jgi:cobyric acid synthase
MLERNIDEPTGIKGAIGSYEGLLYLLISTTLHTAKQLVMVDYY